MDMQTLFITTGVAFVVGVILGPLVIPILRKLKFGQAIRAEGPQAHLKKAGTPTMGGLIILAALTFTSLIFSDRSWDVLLLLIVTLGYGLVGFLDDYIKVVMKRNLGLRAKQKLLGQIIIGLIFFLILYFRGFDMTVDIPGTGLHWNLGLLYLPFLIFVVIGTSNAVNLTDGLDGLAAGTTAIAFGAYAIIALLGTKYDVAVFCAAMVGGVLAFLVFNAHPAKVFMGDTGSLAIGGALAAVAVLTKTEFLLVLIGGVFVIEALSVIIQVISFQTTGKRVFKMSPLHHHFELSGWSEWRVVGTFWMAGLFLSMGALALYMK
jgi:phospho-N-acetylmuramoyl-pentapeptide-transferase